MRKKFLSLALAMGLLVSLAAGVMTVSADDHVDRYIINYDSIYFPWVPNGDEINGTGPWHGSVTIQNATSHHHGVRIYAFTDDWIWSVANDPAVTFENALTGVPGAAQRFSAGDRVPSFVLAPKASQTISPQLLGIDNPGSGVVIYGVYRAALDAVDAGVGYYDCHENNLGNAGVIGPPPNNGIDDRERLCAFDAPVLAGVAKQAAAEPMTGTGARTNSSHVSVDGYTAIPFVDVSWGSQSNTCFEIRNGVDMCDGAGYYTSPGGFGPNWDFDGHSYLPIAQSNSGWNTVIALTNVDFTNTTAASVDVTLITTDQQGYGASGAYKWAENISIAPGSTYVLDIAALVGPEWVGSVHMTSEVGIAAVAYRSKPEDNMMMINQSAPSLWANPALLDDGLEYIPTLNDATPAAIGVDKYEQYAPLVFQSYNGWNTGFSFVNNAEATNTVTVTYYGPTGNVVGGDSRTISPLGQEFIYIPNQQDLDLGPGFVGSAVFSSDLPFHIAVDQVKYSTGEAMSYLATASGAGAGWYNDEWPAYYGRNALFLPLFQKGGQDGSGDISGIQLFNASGHNPTSVEITFYDGSGSAIAPSKDTPYVIPAIQPAGNFTVYSLTLSEMSQGQRSSAIIEPAKNSPNGQIVGVSNNVNYDVQGDGSAAYNLVNGTGQYRFPFPNFFAYEEGDDYGDIIIIIPIEEV